jgi:hypothetical protein
MHQQTNGLIGLVDFGLANYYDGFGPYIDKPPETSKFSSLVVLRGILSVCFCARRDRVVWCTFFDLFVRRIIVRLKFVVVAQECGGCLYIIVIDVADISLL